MYVCTLVCMRRVGGAVSGREEAGEVTSADSYVLQRGQGQDQVRSGVGAMYVCMYVCARIVVVVVLYGGCVSLSA